MVNASISTPASSNSNDFAKKKRVNRTAKLKQSKLDVRREQWLSQVKNKGIGLKEEGKCVKMPVKETHAVRERERETSVVKLEICVGGGEENEGLMGNYSDNESPLSHTSSGNRSVTNFTGSSMSSSGSSSSSSSRGCCSAEMAVIESQLAKLNEHDDLKKRLEEARADRFRKKMEIKEFKLLERNTDEMTSEELEKFKKKKRSLLSRLLG